MKIVVTTPLYPPEIGDPAPYVKELARRLSRDHEVTIVLYGYLPEKIPSVSFVPINKRSPLPIRLFQFTLALIRALRKADILYAENGASVELPAGIIALLMQKPLILHVGDKIAQDKAKENFLLRSIHNFARRSARTVINTIPNVRPEILPFAPKPEEEFNDYEKSWDIHINTLEEIFTHEK